jgi:hypothetical protein
MRIRPVQPMWLSLILSFGTIFRDWRMTGKRLVRQHPACVIGKTERGHPV